MTRCLTSLSATANCRPAVWAAVLVLLTLGGCAGKRAAQGVNFHAQNYPAIYASAIETLRSTGFEIDRQDYRFGIITSRPLGSPSIFEPWRHTHTSLGQTLESTVNDQQRIVRISLEQVGEPAAQPSAQDLAAALDDPTAAAPARPGDYRLQVQVMIERRQTPARRLSGSTAPMRIFTNLRQLPAPLREQDVDREYWLPVGRDRKLEERLAARIMREADKLPQTSFLTPQGR